MIFTPDRRPKIIPPATFSLSNPGDPVFNNTLLKSTFEEIKQTAVRFPSKFQGVAFSAVFLQGRRFG
jgi:hypothetical protein